VLALTSKQQIDRPQPPKPEQAIDSAQRDVAEVRDLVAQRGPCPPHLVSLRAGPRQPVAPESSAASLLVILGLGQRLELSVGELEVEGSEVFLKCSRESVPGIGSIVGERRSSQARTTCAGVAPWRSAISATSGRAPPFNGK